MKNTKRKTEVLRFRSEFSIALVLCLIIIGFNTNGCSSNEVEEFTTYEPELTEEVIKVVENQGFRVISFHAIEIQPMFQEGGTKGYYQELMAKLKYPQRTKDMGIEGRVIVSLTISSEGKVQDVEVLKGIGAGCDEEAKRVVKSIADWLPAMTKGNPIKSKMVIPIVFKLS